MLFQMILYRERIIQYRDGIINNPIKVLDNFENSSILRNTGKLSENYAIKSYFT